MKISQNHAQIYLLGERKILKNIKNQPISLSRLPLADKHYQNLITN
jgi:hypothetical protein